ncbi:MAG: MFS transporter [Pseudomonadales bacterium]|nr:MFS transporter [Pseudomonadales bacterium]
MWLRRFSPARWLLISVAVTSFCLSPFMTFMPLYARDVFHGGPQTLGWLMGCSGAGALVITLVLASRRSPHGLNRLAWLGLSVAALVTLAFAYNRSLYLALPLLFLSGGSFIAIVTSCNIMLQSVVPDRLRGRVMALYSMSFLGMMPLGSLLNGVLARAFGTPNTFVLSGCMALILVTTLYFRRHNLQSELAQGINHPENSELLQDTFKT